MKIATIKGIEIKLHYSTLVIIGLIGLGAASFYQSLTESSLSILELVVFGLVNGILLLLSILIHEVMHSLTAIKRGHRVEEIELYIFGGAAKSKDEFKNPKDEMRIAAAGPLASILIGGLMIGAIFIPWNLPIFIYATFTYIGFSNLILAAFNLVPAFPMDGGRILRAYLWKKRGDILSATKTAVKGGKIFGNFLIGLGIFEIFFFGSFYGIWSILIGFFIKKTAAQSYQQTLYLEILSNFKMKDLLGQGTLSIYKETTVLDAINNYFVPFKNKYFPIRDEEKIIGLLQAKDIHKLPMEKRELTQIEQLMVPLQKIPSVGAELSAKTAFLEMIGGDFPIKVFAVYDKEHKFLGFISKENFISAIYFNKNIHRNSPEIEFGKNYEKIITER